MSDASVADLGRWAGPRADGRVRVKVCGVTTPEDVEAVCAAGADFVGLNFHPPSPRCLTPERAAELRRLLPGDVAAVGVFVNLPLDEVRRVRDVVGLDLVQFHGDEGPAESAPLAAAGIRALRLGVGRMPTAGELRAFWAVLVDAPTRELYGGSGEAWDWSAARTFCDAHRVLLAGGLRHDNVGAALRAVPGVHAVDVCSGVEETPGRKSSELVRRFVAAVAAVPAARSGAPPGRVPTDTAPIDTAPIDTGPTDTGPTDTVPIDTVPTDRQGGDPP